MTTCPLSHWDSSGMMKSESSATWMELLTSCLSPFNRFNASIVESTSSAQMSQLIHSPQANCALMATHCNADSLVVDVHKYNTLKWWTHGPKSYPQLVKLSLLCMYCTKFWISDQIWESYKTKQARSGLVVLLELTL